jgi:ABC-type transport system substrate-binding protein
MRAQGCSITCSASGSTTRYGTGRTVRQQSAQYKGSNPTGADVQVANAGYSGPVKPHAVRTIDYLPYVSETAEQRDLRAGTLDVGYLAPNDVGRSPGPGRAGAIPSKLHLSNYVAVGSPNWGEFDWAINFDDSYSTYQTQGPLPLWADELNNRYFRDAMQEAIDQPAVIKGTMNGYGIDTYSAVPAYPKNEFSARVTNPWGYDPSQARALMEANGWSGGTPATCLQTNCGSSQYPIPAGSKAIVVLLYPGSDPQVSLAVNEEKATIAAAGIEVDLQNSSGGDSWRHIVC